MRKRSRRGKLRASATLQQRLLEDYAEAEETVSFHLSDSESSQATAGAVLPTVEGDQASDEDQKNDPQSVLTRDVPSSSYDDAEEMDTAEPRAIPLLPLHRSRTDSADHRRLRHQQSHAQVFYLPELIEAGVASPREIRSESEYQSTKYRGFFLDPRFQNLVAWFQQHRLSLVSFLDVAKDAWQEAQTQARKNAYQGGSLRRHVFSNAAQLPEEETFLGDTLGKHLESILLALDELVTLEGRPVVSRLRTINLEDLLEKLSYAFVVNENSLQEDRGCLGRPVCMHGRNIPMRNDRAIIVANVFSSISQNTSAMLALNWRITLGILVGYQLINNPLDLFSVLNAIWNASSSGVNSLVHFFYSPYSWAAYAGLAFAPLYGLGRGIHKLVLKILEEKMTWEHRKRLLKFFQKRIDRNRRLGWHEGLRWLFPLPPHRYEGRFKLLEDLLRWDGRSSSSPDNISPLQHQLFAINLFVYFAQHGRYITRLHALHVLAKIAHGLSTQHIDLLLKFRTGYAPEDVCRMLYAKAVALIVLRRQAQPAVLLGDERSRLERWIHRIAAHNYLWRLGKPRHWLLAVVFALIEFGLFFSNVWLLKTMVQGFVTYLQCPDKPFTYAQLFDEPINADYSVTCFLAVLKLLNDPVPGQPIEELLALIPDFGSQLKRAGFSHLNLSNKSLTGDAIARIVRALQAQNLRITHLNLSGNNLNTAADFEALASCDLATVQVLNLSNNQMESFGSSAATRAFAQLCLPKLGALEELYLDGRNNIGAYDSLGVQALGENLHFLLRLKIFSAPQNNLELIDTLGTQKLAQGFVACRQLERVILTENDLGFTNSTGMIALGHAFSEIPKLSTVRVDSNNIDNTDTLGSQAIFTGIARKNMTWIDVSNNEISNPSLMLLIQEIPNFPSLQTLHLIQPEGLNNATLTALNQALADRQIQTDIPIFDTEVNINGYFQRLGNHTTQIDLSYHLRGATAAIMTQVAQAIVRYCPQVQRINLSNNNLCRSQTEVLAFQAFCHVLQANPLAYFNQLDISNNFLGFTGDIEVCALAEMIQAQPRFTHFNANNNFVGKTGSNGTVRLLQACAQVPIQSISAVNNGFGLTDSLAGQALGALLNQSSTIQTINFQKNFFGLTSNLGESAIGRGLQGESSQSIVSLNLGDCHLGQHGSAGPIAILSAIPNLSNLRSLNLDRINISYAEGHAILANTPQLFLNQQKILAACQQQVCFNVSTLPDSHFSVRLHREPVSAASASTPYWVQALESISHLFSAKPESLNEAQGFNGAEMVEDEVFYDCTDAHFDQMVSRAAQAQNIHTEIFSCTYSNQQLFCVSEDQHTTRLVTPLEGALNRNLQGDHYHTCESQVLSDSTELRHCIGEQTEFIERQQSSVASQSTVEFSLTNTLKNAAIAGAVFGIVPELVSDTTKALGYSETTANRAQIVTHAALMLASGAFVSSGVRIATAAASKYLLGCNNSTALLYGERAATAVGVGMNLTGAGLLNTGIGMTAGYAAARIGLWAKRKIVEKLTQLPRKQNAYTRVL